MNQSTHKACSRCSEIKPLDSYYVRNEKPQAACKACINAASRAWAKANPERAAEISAAWQRRNKDKVRAHNVEWYHSDRERNLARAAEWKRENFERNRASMDAWRARPENAERIRATAAKSRMKNAAKIKARLRANPEKGRLDANRRRARKLAATVGEIDLRVLWIRQCGTCALCELHIDYSVAWPDPMSKSVDHIIPLSRGGTHEQSNLQWTHLVCNLRKGNRLPG